MVFEDMKFMSIGGNCAPIGFLGKDRIRGPVDNLAGVRDKLCFECLFDGTFLEDFKKEPKIENRHPGYTGDSDKAYIYEHYAVCHNNPFEEKYKIELKKRYETFLDFYSHIELPAYYFTYSLNTEISKTRNKIQNKELIDKEISFLKDKGLFQKTIFVGTKNVNVKNNWNYYAKEFEEEYPDVLYVELLDLNVFDPVKSFEQFKGKICALFHIERGKE